MSTNVQGSVILEFKGLTEDLDRRLREVEKKLGEFDKNFAKVSDTGKKVEDNLVKNLKGVQKEMKAVRKTLQNYVVLPFIAGMGLMIKNASDFEDAMADVAKTVGGTPEEIAILGKEILGISRSTRTPIKDLQEMAATAGQMGFDVKGDTGIISALDDLYIALGRDFPGGTRVFATEMGKLRNNLLDIRTDDPTEDFLRIGNAVNLVAKTSETSAGTVIDFTKRLIEQAGHLGLTADQAIGLSAAMDSMGITPERGGRNAGQMMAFIARNSENFAKTLNLPLDEFQHLINTDVNAAFLLVSKRMNELPKSVIESSQLFKELEINASGATAVMSKIGRDPEKATFLQGLAAEGLTNYDSILEEVDFRQSTFRASLGRLNNAWKEFGVDTLSDDGNSGLSGLSNFVDKLTELITFITDLPAGFKNLAINTGLFFTVIVGGLFAFEKFVDIFLWYKKSKVVGFLTTGIKNLVVAIKTMTFAKAIAGLKAMGTAVVLLTKKLALMMLSPFFLIPVVIIGIVAALWWLWNNSDLVVQKLSEAWDWVAEKFGEAWDWIKNKISGVWQSIRNTIGNMVRGFVDGFKRIFGITEDVNTFALVIERIFWTLVGFIIGLFIMIPHHVGKAMSAFANVILHWVSTAGKWFGDQSKKMIDAVVRYFVALPGRISSAMSAMRSTIVRWWNSSRTWLINSVRNTISAIGNFFWQLPGNIVNALRNVRAWVINIFNEIRHNAVSQTIALINGVSNWFRTLPGRISGAIGSLFSSGRQLFRSFIDGLISAAGRAGAGIRQGLRLAGVPGFKDGGIVGGNSKSGDKVLIRANSGEMMLNMSQQANLFNMIDSGSFAGAGGGDIMITINNPSVRNDGDLRDMRRLILDTVNEATRKKEYGV